ncbi:MAG: putative O-methyltransferase YrrM [Arcticibacterium sp.]|jgi:predicted O-methyltransferase YrrM
MFADFVKYALKAKNQHVIHSPFLFEFYLTCIKSKSLPFDNLEIQKYRNELLKDKREIKINDLGAGSKYSNKSHKSVCSIAKTAKKSEKWANILARIVAKYKYSTSIELGTSLGLSSLMIAKANPYGKVYTFEGCPETLNIAKEGFNKLGMSNITPLLGDIAQTLNTVLSQISRLDFAFFDANHQYDATMSYFRSCLGKAHENSCFVFDDIYWSEGMKKAWEEIKEHPEVTISLDFFQIGIVFFRKNQPKQHFVLRS